MAMGLSTDLMLRGTIAACVSANDGLGKQLNNSRQLAVPARLACMLPGRHSLSNRNKQPCKRMLLPYARCQPSPLNSNK
jgi:hypothetical protein